MKKFLAILCVFVLLAAAGGWFAYNKWKTGPSYSLIQAGLALKNNDKAAIEQYIDLDGVLNNAVDIFVEEGIKQASAEEKDNGVALMAMGFISALKPQMVAAMKESVLKAVDEAKNDKNAKENKKQLEESINIKSVKTLQRNGDNASVEVIMDIPENKDSRFVLGMRRYGDYWKVEKLENPQENILKWLEEEMKSQEQHQH